MSVCESNKNKVGILSDRGNFRTINQDYLDYYENEKIKFYVIADGMGGHKAGEIASKLAVDTSINYVKNKTNIIDNERFLAEAIEKANNKVYELSLKNEDFSGMGTTITACMIYNNNLLVANVGDSSCYVLTHDNLNKITKDHSLVQELVDKGSLTVEEAKTHPNKNIITRALGTKEIVDIDIFKKDITNIEKVILCTDGVTNEITDKEMYDIIVKHDNIESCRLIVDLCKQKGGKDNISVIVFEGECRYDRKVIRK